VTLWFQAKSVSVSVVTAQDPAIRELITFMLLLTSLTTLVFQQSVSDVLAQKSVYDVVTLNT